MLRALTATVCSGALLGGCGATWPNRAAALATPRVHQITTVDVLPVDLEVWAEKGYPYAPEDVRHDASIDLQTSAIDLLQKNGYAIDGLIDWNGEIDGRGAVLERGDLEQTIAALASYDLKTGRFPIRLPDPQLPAKLGAVSGADATLYIGGWAYVAAQHESTGEKVAEGILIGVAIVAVVAIVAIALSSKGSGHSGGGGSHGGGGGSHGGGGGHSAPTFHDHRGGVSVNDQPTFVTVGTASIRDHRGGGSWSPSRTPQAVHASSGPAVHIDTAIDVVDSIDPQTVSHPDWSGDVPSGEDSQMYLEMTLVDNATGTVLWHAHQKFPANAASKEDVARATRTLIASLPAH